MGKAVRKPVLLWRKTVLYFLERCISLSIKDLNGCIHTLNWSCTMSDVIIIVLFKPTINSFAFCKSAVAKSTVWPYGMNSYDPTATFRLWVMFAVKCVLYTLLVKLSVSVASLEDQWDISGPGISKRVVRKTNVKERQSQNVQVHNT